MTENTYVFYVTYTGTITEKVVMEGTTKEEAKEKIKNGEDPLDVLDDYTEIEELIYIE